MSWWYARNPRKEPVKTAGARAIKSTRASKTANHDVKSYSFNPLKTEVTKIKMRCLLTENTPSPLHEPTCRWRLLQEPHALHQCTVWLKGRVYGRYTQLQLGATGFSGDRSCTQARRTLITQKAELFSR